MKEFSSDRRVTGELELNNCGIQILRGSDNFTVRTRKDHTVMYLASGRAYLSDRSGNITEVSEGQAMYFMPEAEQMYRFDTSCDNLNMWVHFGGSFCDILGKDTTARVITVSDRNEFESCIERLCAAHNSIVHENEKELLCNGYLRVLIALALRDEKKNTKSFKPENRLHKVLYTVNTTVGQDINWDECAAQCFMSRDRFNHVFREHVGMSPESYRIKVCMDRAKLLLCDFGLSVSECAETLGFSDVSYFCRRFRKEFGISPGQMKEKSH